MKGQPLASRQIVATLEPGLYRVTAYGGPETPWTKTASERPLYVRFGTEARKGAGREARAVSALGRDRLVLPGSTTLVRVELPTTDGCEHAGRWRRGR